MLNTENSCTRLGYSSCLLLSSLIFSLFDQVKKKWELFLSIITRGKEKHEWWSFSQKTLKPHKTFVCNFVQITLGGEVMQSTRDRMKSTQVTSNKISP
uniref:Putative ovule protein n=1 Tax=Solanum chacoense TaxID=4108 RepID=A0A0V0H3C6_SOLCH